MIAEWDSETRRLFKLGLPFLLQAFLEGVVDSGQVAIVGKLMSSDDSVSILGQDCFLDGSSSCECVFVGGVSGFDWSYW